MAKTTRYIPLFLILVSFSFKVCYSQIVPFYPIEIFFNPCGYTNSIPGCKPDLYTTFSSLKVVLNKDLPSTPKLTNTLSFVGNIELYHSITKSRAYHPFSLNPAIRTHFFMNDVFTPSLEVNGNVEFLPGVDLNGNLFRYTNYRIRVRPFFYLIISPNVIFEQIFTYGKSYNTEKTAMATLNGPPELVSRDYYIMRYEATGVYFSKFHTRFFLSPYVFKNQYYDLATAGNGKIDKSSPKLNEMGFGGAFGMRYSTFTMGYAEGVFEIERNLDVSSDANTYTKYKFTTKWENQYFTERFGYAVMFDVIRHDFVHAVYNFQAKTDDEKELGRLEIRFDVMPIINLNRNVSVRPEFDLFYKDVPGPNDTRKYRYWLHLHVLF